MKRIKYVGPFDAVEVAGLVCEQGKTVEVPEDLAESLLEQEANWQPVTAGKKKETD